MIQDALRVYSYLHKIGKHDFADKINELRSMNELKPNSETDKISLSEVFVSQESATNPDIYVNETKNHGTNETVEIGKQEPVLLAEYDSLINLLFTDEEKSYFQIVPSEEFYFNKENELVSIFFEKEEGKDTINNFEETKETNFDYSEILESNQDINPEVTVEDFINILYTYYNKDTKISEIKIGDLFLLLSSIKLENN